MMDERAEIRDQGSGVRDQGSGIRVPAFGVLDWKASRISGLLRNSAAAEICVSYRAPGKRREDGARSI